VYVQAAAYARDASLCFFLCGLGGATPCTCPSPATEVYQSFAEAWYQVATSSLPPDYAVSNR
jgi:hypothetical protein